MTKREEAARALLRVELSQPEFYGAGGRGLEKAIEEEWKDWLPHVDAVIACIREPDEKMLTAAWGWTQKGSTSEQRMITALGSPRKSHDYKMCGRLQAMLDAME